MRIGADVKNCVILSKLLVVLFAIIVIFADLYGIVRFGIENFPSYFLGRIEGSGWDNVPPYMAHVGLLIFLIGYFVSIWQKKKLDQIEEERKKFDEERKR